MAHDAGFDSYMTGVVFAHLAKRIEMDLLISQNPAAAANHLPQE